MKDLSASRVWENSMDANHDQSKSSQRMEYPFKSGKREKANYSTDGHQEGGRPYPHMPSMSPMKLMRQKMWQERRDLQTALLIQQDKASNNKMAVAAIERSKSLDTTVKGQYSIWRTRIELFGNLAHCHRDSSLFYKLTYPLNRGWHDFGLGHDPALNLTEIENAAVIHYNGNYKPRLDLSVLKYKYYWFRYLVYDNPYRGLCDITERIFFAHFTPSNLHM